MSGRSVVYRTFVLWSSFLPASANRVTEGYNKKLKRMVEKMNQEMGPESKFVYTNTYEIVMEIIQDYRQYGTLSDLRTPNSTPPAVGVPEHTENRLW